MRLRTFHDRVPRMHRPLLDVAATARERAASPASRCGRAQRFFLRGRHSLARLRPCELLPAAWGDSSTGELCFRTAGIGVRFPVAPPMWDPGGSPHRYAVSLPPPTRLRRCLVLRTSAAGWRVGGPPHFAEGDGAARWRHSWSPALRLGFFGAVAQIGERLDGIEKVAGAIPASSTASNADVDYMTIMVLRQRCSGDRDSDGSTPIVPSGTIGWTAGRTGEKSSM